MEISKYFVVVEDLRMLPISGFNPINIALMFGNAELGRLLV